jgi:hypothetical protein
MCLCNLQQRPVYQQHSGHAERVSAVCVCVCSCVDALLCAYAICSNVLRISSIVVMQKG